MEMVVGVNQTRGDQTAFSVNYLAVMNF